MDEGWYLMSPADLERELARWRDPSAPVGASNAERLSIEDALAYRNAGNLPDERERSLRLVLKIEDPSDVPSLERKRARYEPDYHDAPRWRRRGSKPVNVVPLTASRPRAARQAWYEDPDLARLEEEWQRTGRVHGISLPSDYRAFVYKTVLALRRAAREVTVESIAASISRWVTPEQAEEIASALRSANRSSDS